MTKDQYIKHLESDLQEVANLLEGAHSYFYDRGSGLRPVSVYKLHNLRGRILGHLEMGKHVT